MNTSTLLGLVIVILLGLGGWYFYTMNPSLVPAPANNTTNTNTPSDTNSGTTGGDTNVNIDVTVPTAQTSATVTYSTNGFSPSPVTIKKGGTVTFVDSNPARDMWVASAQHPTHTAYSGTTLAEHCDDATDTSFDQCKAGSSYSFTFTKAGTWNYHNHLNSSDFGQIIVVE